MGIHIDLWQVSLVVAVLCTTACGSPALQAPTQPPVLQLGAARCGPERYWSSSQRRCLDCSHCSGPGREVTLKPCEGHRDALCGSVADLHIDWSWLREHHTDHPRSGKRKGHPGVHERVNSLSEAEALLLDGLHQGALHQAHHAPLVAASHQVVDFGDDYILPDKPRQPNHKKEKKKRLHKGKLAASRRFNDYDDMADFGASGDGEVTDDEDLYRRAHRPAHRPAAAPRTTTTTTTTTTTARPTTDAVNLVEDFIVMKDDDVVSTKETFTTAETLVWDWQAGVLVAAVCACLLFFVVAAVYSCQHAWHFRALKKHLDADMEEISARLALMSGIGSEHLHEPGAAPEKAAIASRRGDTPYSGRQQNEYCLAAMPRKTRV